jgi:hypothetical protein
MDRENDSVVKRKIRAVIDLILWCLIFVVKDGRNFATSLYWFIKNSTGNSTMDKETTLTERTACLNGKFLKDFHFSVFIFFIV